MIEKTGEGKWRSAMRWVMLMGVAMLLGTTGCRSGKDLQLLRPGDVAVYDRADTAAMLAEQSTAPRVELRTSLGTVVVELYEDAAPVSVDNFLQYVEEGFYDGTIFHRVISGFMVQGGGFTADMEVKPTRGSIENEAGNGLRNRRGTLAMARTQAMDSANSQFYINLVDNAFLDGDGVETGYAVFGRVYAGMDVVDRMATQATQRTGQFEDVPVEPIVIESARRIQ